MKIQQEMSVIWRLQPYIIRFVSPKFILLGGWSSDDTTSRSPGETIPRLCPTGGSNHWSRPATNHRPSLPMSYCWLHGGIAVLVLAGGQVVSGVGLISCLRLRTHTAVCLFVRNFTMIL